VCSTDIGSVQLDLKANEDLNESRVQKMNRPSRLIPLLILPLMLVSLLFGCTKTRKVLGAHKTDWKQEELIITYSCSAPPTETSVKNSAAEDFNLIPNAEETLDLAQKNILQT